jgi:lipoate-protein ligase B
MNAAAAPRAGEDWARLPGIELVPASAGGAAPSVRCRWLGRIGFAAALELQETIAGAHERFGDTLLLLEHDPVYTTGRGGRVQNLGGLSEATGGTGTPLVRIGRGGDVTYHGPGQLVGYALIDLRARGGDVHRFLRQLESGVIASLDALAVHATRWPGRTGVWVSDAADTTTLGADDMPHGRIRKIASIGIAVRRGISMHGFALNVGFDLAPFAAIVPCGLAGVRMTSIAHEARGPVPALETVAALAAQHVAAALSSRADLTSSRSAP